MSKLEQMVSDDAWEEAYPEEHEGMEEIRNHEDCKDEELEEFNNVNEMCRICKLTEVDVKDGICENCIDNAINERGDVEV